MIVLQKVRRAEHTKYINQNGTVMRAVPRPLPPAPNTGKHRGKKVEGNFLKNQESEWIFIFLSFTQNPNFPSTVFSHII